MKFGGMTDQLHQNAEKKKFRICAIAISCSPHSSSPPYTRKLLVYQARPSLTLQKSENFLEVERGSSLIDWEDT